MTEIGIPTLLLLIANIFCSVQGLNDRLSFERFNFHIKKILVHKNHERLVTAGFFHVNWLHLALNIASLCFLSGGLELQLGGAKYLLIFFASLLGGNLFALFIYRHRANFNASGATGGITGILFATIALFPGFQIGFLGIHFPIPVWFYGFLYVLFSLYGIKSQRDNIGHEANLAGGLAGLITALLLSPTSFSSNYLAILCITIPTIFFIFIIVSMPRFILVHNNFFDQRTKPPATVLVVPAEKIDHQQEIDLILEKIHQNGIGSLTKTELDKLDYYSKILR